MTAFSAIAPIDTWTLAGSGVWSSAGNWSLGVPTSGENVAIFTATPDVVTFDLSGFSVGSLTIGDDTLTLQGGSLTARGGANFTGATVNGAKALTLAGASSVAGLTLGGAATLVNLGTITQSGGAVAIGDSPTSTALVRNVAGATWDITDDSGMTQGATKGWQFVNSGLFEKTGGSGVSLIKANFLSTGTIASLIGGRDIEFDGAVTMLSGTYIGPGMVDYGPDGVSLVGPVTVTQSSCQTVFGTVDLVGDMLMDDGSTIMMDMGSRWNFDGDSSLLLAPGQGEGPVIDGMGAIAKIAGTGVSHIGIDVSTMGAISVLTGTLSLEGGSSSFSGLVSGAGTFEIGAGSATVAAGARLTVAHWTLAGGATTLGESLAYAGGFSGAAGAMLNFAGQSLTLSGGASFSGLTLAGAGALTLRGATQVSGLTIGGAAHLNVMGAATQAEGATATLGDGVASDAAYLTLGAGGSWAMTDGALALGADPASAIVIASGGLLAQTGAGSAVVAPSVVNNSAAGAHGGLAALSGTLDLKGAVRGTGVDSLVGAATLEFESVVAATQTVQFQGAAGGSLELTDLGDYHAAIVGFAAGDTLLIGGDWSFAGAHATSSAATLSFADTTTHAKTTLTLDGNYTAGTFTPGGSKGMLSISYG